MSSSSENSDNDLQKSQFQAKPKNNLKREMEIL